MENFEKYARFYDLFYQNKNYEKESEVLKSLMIKLHIHESSDILEIGCGTGKHLEHIIKYYPKCLGVEPSNVMIDQAPPYLRERIYNQSAELLNLGKKFDFIYMLFHVFSYLNDIDIFFNKLSQHTKQNAIICMDYWQVTGVYFLKPEVRSQWIESIDTKIQRIATPRISRDGRFVDIEYDIYIHDLSDNSIDYFSEKHRMFVYSADEIITVARRHGFSLLERCHLTKGKAPEFSDWDAGLVFQRIE